MVKTKCPQCGSKFHNSCEVDCAKINGLQVFDKDVEPEFSARLSALLDDLQGPLFAHLSKKSDNFKPLMFRIRLLGSDENSAKPWLVVFCPANVVKNVESFFHKDLARNSCAEVDVEGGLEVAYVGRPLRFKSGLWNEVEVAFATTGIPFGHSWSGLITLTQLSIEHHAAMGGMLVANGVHGADVILGLTVGHLLHYENVTGASLLNVDFDGSGFTPTLEGSHTSELSRRTLGHISEVSFSAKARDLDWALIEFSDATRVADFGTNEAHEQFILGHCQGTVGFRPNPLSLGAAKISNLPARAILPMGESFIKIHPMTIMGVEDFELPVGCSGSWVVSEEATMDTNDDNQETISRIVCVHGVVIADDCYGEVYMVPLADIMDDTKQALKATSVSLPRDTREIIRLIESQSFRVSVGSPPSPLPVASTVAESPGLSSTLTKSAQLRASSLPPSTTERTTFKGHVWYCHECGDGPRGVWNKICQICEHSLCESCQLEHV